MANFSTKINGGIDGPGRNTDKKKARHGLHVCAHCKREVYQKDGNCLDLEDNKAKGYPGWKIVFTKEYDEMGCAISSMVV